MICFLDLDGVLVDFVKGACEFHKLPYSYDSYPFQYGKWDVLPPATANMTTREFWDSLDADFWSSLEWMPDGKEILDFVEGLFGEKNICLLTTPTLSSGCSAGKIEWIRKNLPKYHRQFFIGPPKHFCAHDRAVLIDDRDKNVDDFIDSGGYGLLVSRPWNKNWALRNHSLEHLKLNLMELYSEYEIWKD